ncbi:MAG: serine hydrolase [Phycisphaerae bacterium]|nr:serine hydrolase [Gemmatimonadaceae bacterium]
MQSPLFSRGVETHLSNHRPHDRIKGLCNPGTLLKLPIVKTNSLSNPRFGIATARAFALATFAACAHSPAAPTPLTPSAHSAPERRDADLQAKLEALITGFKGDVGIYVHHLKTGATASIRANEVFPTASMIKVPILVGTFDAIQKGQFTFQQNVTYHDSLRYQYDDSLSVPRAGAKISIARLALQMITESNNTSSLWLQGLVGGANINAWLQQHGFDSTRVNSRVAGREADRTKYGWGQTTPREMATLLVMVREGRAVNRGASEQMYRHLTRIYWNGEALSQLPPYVQVASKQGSVDRSRSEAVLVNAPSGDYVFAVITRNQEDTSYRDDNAGYVLIRRVSAFLWREFEPNHPFVPDSAATRRFKPPEEP